MSDRSTGGTRFRRIFPIEDAGVVVSSEAYTDPPALRANMVGSLDGAAALEGRTAPLSSDGDRALFHSLRAHSDAVLVGAGTARTERYGAITLPADAIAGRQARGLAPLPALAVVSGSADLDPSSALFQGGAAKTVVLTCAAAPAVRRRALSEVAEVVVAGEDRVDLPGSLALLAARGLEHVLCEGGPTLLSALLDAGLVDELCLTLSPLLVGAGSLSLTAGLRAPLPLRIREVLEHDGFLFLRAAARPAGGAGATGMPTATSAAGGTGDGTP